MTDTAGVCMLTDTAARNIKFNDKPIKLSDERGLYLLVNKAGKYWRMDYRFSDKRKTMALGVYPETSLKDARIKRDEARRMLAEGIDPNQMRKQEKIAAKLSGENSFEKIAREWHNTQLARWSEGHAVRVIHSLEEDAFPPLGAYPITDLTAPMILDVIRKIEQRGATETAGRILQRISSVIRFAVQIGKATSNPARDLTGVLTATKVEHRPALPRTELPEFFRRLNAEPLYPATKLAIKLLMLTMTRPGEIRYARWSEFDFDRSEWRIPAERMKMREEHLVPLSRQALAILDELKLHTGHRELLFPSQTTITRPMSENTMVYAFGRMGYKGVATPHGMRALASTTLNEEGFDPDVIERQLAHAERNKVRAAYHRAQYINDRRELLQWWGDYLQSQEENKTATTN